MWMPHFKDINSDGQEGRKSDKTLHYRKRLPQNESILNCLRTTQIRYASPMKIALKIPKIKTPMPKWTATPSLFESMTKLTISQPLQPWQKAKTLTPISLKAASPTQNSKHST